MHKWPYCINVPFNTRTIMKVTVHIYLYIPSYRLLFIYKDKYEYLLMIIT